MGATCHLSTDTPSTVVCVLIIKVCIDGSRNAEGPSFPEKSRRILQQNMCTCMCMWEKESIGLGG